MLTIQNYVRAQSLEEAYTLNQKKSNRVIGGMLWLKMSSGNVNTAIDLCDLGLDKIEETEETFSIGSMVTLRQLEQHPGLDTYSKGAVATALESIVGVQFRNMATVGGSLWGRFGFSDVLTVFLAMDSYVELYHGGVIPLEQFTSMDYDNDILVKLIIKKKNINIVYKSMRNQKTDFPVLTCAFSKVDGDYRSVIGARPGRAKVLYDIDQILKEGIHEESAKTFASYVAENTRTGSNIRAGAAYRSHLVEVLTLRSVMELGGLA